MTYTRTRQQIAFDGVRFAWHRDVAARSVSHAAQRPRSMDGVVCTPFGASREYVATKFPEQQESFSVAQAFQKVFGSDGIRVPVGRIA